MYNSNTSVSMKSDVAQLLYGYHLNAENGYPITLSHSDLEFKVAEIITSDAPELDTLKLKNIRDCGGVAKRRRRRILLLPQSKHHSQLGSDCMRRYLAFSDIRFLETK